MTEAHENLDHARPRQRFLNADTAREQRRAHEERADALTAGHRERKARGQKHPVEDFLFTYYPFSPARLRRWHPGWNTSYDPRADLDDWGRPVITDLDEHGSRSWYVDEPADNHAPADEEAAPMQRRADVERFASERGDAVRFIGELLSRSSRQNRRPEFGCFGLHEWAMVYRLRSGNRRHENLPLRLSESETNAVVERENLVCTHIDAFRFFTPEAEPRNAHAPTRATQTQLDNPACLHVGMDLYKWAMKLTPLVPSALVLDCFEHAQRTRILDMEASPYDVRPLGYGVVPIETAEGKAEYVRRQRELAEGAEHLRRQLLEVLRGVDEQELRK